MSVALAALCVLGAAAGGTAAAQSDPRIVGGQPAPAGAYPWMAALVDARSDEPVQQCGGTLVGPETVLTAAHCLAGFVPRDFDVVIGRDRLSDQAAGQRIAIDRYALEPDGIDVATIRLAEPAAPTPVSLATRADAPLFAEGMPATALGWGATNENATHGTDELRQVEVPITDERSCARAYRETAGFFDSRHSICAGARRRDACSGDSGGSLVVRDSAGAPLQVGVTSYGRGCGRKRFPGVYVLVPSVLDFATDPDPIYAPVPNRRAARITGEQEVGEKLTCVRGGWVGEDIRFRYFWYGGFRAKPLSRNRRFRPDRKLAGSRIACDVVGQTPGGLVAIGSLPVRIHGSRS